MQIEWHHVSWNLIGLAVTDKLDENGRDDGDDNCDDFPSFRPRTMTLLLVRVIMRPATRATVGREIPSPEQVGAMQRVTTGNLPRSEHVCVLRRRRTRTALA